MEKQKSNLAGCLILMLTALIWGSAFVAQSVGMAYIGPFSFNGIRSVIGALALLPCIALLDRLKLSARPRTGAEKKRLLIGGLCCGLVLFAASNFQQIGLISTPPGKGGFITALYIVLVPICGLFVRQSDGTRRKPSLLQWIAVCIALGGMYLLCLSGESAEGLSLASGDLMLVISALFFTLHILVIDHFAPHVDCVRMSCIQFFVSGILSLLCMLLFREELTLTALRQCAIPILYAGVLSSGAGYTLQMIGQRRVAPTLASLILSLESVFSVLASWVLLGDALSLRELLGCALILSAIVIAQLRRG